MRGTSRRMVGGKTGRAANRLSPRPRTLVTTAMGLPAMDDAPADGRQATGTAGSLGKIGARGRGRIGTHAIGASLSEAADEARPGKSGLPATEDAPGRVKKGAPQTCGGGTSYGASPSSGPP